MDAAATWAVDAAQQHALQQQQLSGFTAEQLAALAGAGAGTHGLSAPAPVGPAGSAPTDITLPPVPDLQGTSLAFLQFPGSQQAANHASQQQLQLQGDQQAQLQMQLAALAGGLSDPQQLAGNKRRAGGC